MIARVSPGEALVVVAIVVGWVAMSIGFEWLFDRWSERRNRDRSRPPS